MLRNIIVTAPRAMSGLRISDGLLDCRKNIDPKTKAIINGVNNNIFASGARVSERKPASAITEACSDTHGSCFSRSATDGLSVAVRNPTSDAWDLVELNWPVYRRTVVRYDRS